MSYVEPWQCACTLKHKLRSPAPGTRIEGTATINGVEIRTWDCLTCGEGGGSVVGTASKVLTAVTAHAQEGVPFLKLVRRPALRVILGGKETP